MAIGQLMQEGKLLVTWPYRESVILPSNSLHLNYVYIRRSLRSYYGSFLTSRINIII